MRLLYAGFNLFGLVDDPEAVIKTFKSFPYESLKNLHLTHTFRIAHTETEFVLHGYCEGKTHGRIEMKIDPNETVAKVSAFDDRAFVLSESGRIYEARFSDKVSLKLLEFNDGKIVDIAVGGEMVIVLTEDGNVYNYPDKLDFTNDNIIQIAVGREHCIILDKSGNIYSFGIGSKGQLGHGNLSNQKEPVQVEALAGIKIKKIAAGGWHSCALSDTGDLYSWGWNQDNQLGVLDTEGATKNVFALPEPIDFPDFEAIATDISCGTRHTVALLGTKLFGAGSNKYHQLGSELSDETTTMRCAYVGCEKDKISVTCGPWSTALLIS